MCKNKIHLECLIETTRKNGNVCKTCNGDNGAVFDPNGRLLFPSKGIYKAPLMNHYVIVDSNNKNLQLHYAIAYLQFNQVMKLLTQFSKDDYINYYKKADTYALHLTNKNTGALTLKNMPYTNLSRNSNLELFQSIENCLYVFHKYF